MLVRSFKGISLYGYLVYYLESTSPEQYTSTVSYAFDLHTVVSPSLPHFFSLI